MLGIVIKRAKIRWPNCQVVPYLIRHDLSILQHLDYILIFIYNDLEKAKNIYEVVTLYF